MRCRRFSDSTDEMKALAGRITPVAFARHPLGVIKRSTMLVAASPISTAPSEAVIKFVGPDNSTAAIDETQTNRSTKSRWSRCLWPFVGPRK